MMIYCFQDILWDFVTIEKRLMIEDCARSIHLMLTIPRVRYQPTGSSLPCLLDEGKARM
jgi:hypothetical protein